VTARCEVPVPPFVDLDHPGLTSAEVAVAAWWVADGSGSGAIGSSSGCSRNSVAAGGSSAGPSPCRHPRGRVAPPTVGSPPTAAASA